MALNTITLTLTPESKKKLPLRKVLIYSSQFESGVKQKYQNGSIITV
jgi:hypothetical protein